MEMSNIGIGNEVETHVLLEMEVHEFFVSKNAQSIVFLQYFVQKWKRGDTK